MNSWWVVGAAIVDGQKGREGISCPFGEHAQGTLIYTADGWMSAQLTARDRPSLATDDVAAGPDAKRAAAYSSYLAHRGRYRAEDGVVIHEVQMSLFPNWVGTQPVRLCELAGATLVLRTPPTESPAAPPSTNSAGCARSDPAMRAMSFDD